MRAGAPKPIRKARNVLVVAGRFRYFLQGKKGA
jgi:hypothetical protein